MGLTQVFSPSGKILASCSTDQTVRFWNPRSGELIRTIEAHQGHVYSIGFSPNGKTLASSGLDETIRLWDVELAHIFGHWRHIGMLLLE